jgi:thiol-disulfide isomerase/thioredoxin
MMKRIFTFLFAFAVFGALNAQTLFEANFDSGIPGDVVADDIWQVGSSNTLSSQYFEIPEHGIFVAVNDDAVGNGVDQEGRIISPLLDLTGLEAVVLSFEAYFIDGDYGADEQANVLVSSDEGMTWELATSLPGVNGEWQAIFVDLSEYVDQSILVAFEYKDGGGWNYGFCVDDVKVEALSRWNARLNGLSTLQFQVVEENATIEGTIQNLGFENLTSVDITWAANGEEHTETISGFDLEFAETYDFSHPVAFVPTEAITYDVDVTVSNPNGEEDADMSDNSGATLISGVTFRPDKKVVYEEGTGPWCGWCPRGHVAMEYMKENYEDSFIGVAVHNGSTNPMVVTEHDGNTGITGYPGANIDRTLNGVSVSTDLFIQYMDILNQVAPIAVDVEATYLEDTRELTVEASAEFVTRLSGLDYRFSVIITEDDVVGSSSSYAQANFYSFQSQNLPLTGAGHDWQAAPNPVPAAEMVYKDVSRAILGGYNGTAGAIPADVEAGDVFTQTFTYDIPANYNPENMQAVVIIIDGATGQILNASEADFAVAVNTKDVFANELLEVFPNPSQGKVNISLSLAEATDVQLAVYNTTGQQIMTADLGKLAGDVIVPFDGAQLPAGVYAFHLNLGDKIAVQQVVIE